jgi:hypothetical protein
MKRQGAAMVDDSEIINTIKSMNHEEIAHQLELRRVIRENRLTEMKSIRKSVEVEHQISDVLTKLISRIGRKRGPIPEIIYRQDFETSRKHILALETRLKEIDDLLQAAEIIYHAIKIFIPVNTANYGTLQGFEKVIYDYIKSWDRSLLKEIQRVSKHVVTAISGSTNIVIDGIDILIVIRICENLHTLIAYLNTQKNRLAAESQLTSDEDRQSVYGISWAYTCVLYTAFKNGNYVTEEITANPNNVITNENILYFGLPTVLACFGL